jgi:sugar lactone lactonase YvrE
LITRHVFNSDHTNRGRSRAASKYTQLLSLIRNFNMRFSLPKLMRSALPLSVAFSLAACGGGGGGTPAGTFKFNIGGTISGLSGTVVLQVNNSESLKVIADGVFTFTNPVVGNGAYNVIVVTQPTNQRCMVINGAGSATADVGNVSVRCASQMGGAMQGVGLNLAPTVTTFAGSPFGFDGIGGKAIFHGPSDIANDGSNLYVADAGNNKIRKIVISTGEVTTLAGTGAIGAADGKGAVATFNWPQGITIDATHTNLYVADTSNNKIRKIAIATGDVSTLAGVAYNPDATCTNCAVDSTGTTATFNSPQGITIDATSTNLYVADTSNNKIRKIAIATGDVSTLAGVVYTPGTNSAVDGAGTAATFNRPFGITTDGTSLYVVDNNKIRKIASNGTLSSMTSATAVVSSLTGAANTTGALGAADGVNTASTFGGAGSIATDGTNLYVADQINNKIRKVVIATGEVSSITGMAGTASVIGAADGAVTAATFSFPQGIAVVGNMLYVADTYNDTIRTVSLSLTNATVGTLAGTAFGTDGMGAAASFGNAHGITSDGTNLYVADTDYNKIRKIVIATGEVTTFAGTGAAGAVDGIGAAGPIDGFNVEATFNEPWGITTDGANLYVADRANNKIRKIVISTGEVSSFTGALNTAVAAGAADGTGAAVSFHTPMGITCDGANLYVTDTYNDKIRKIVIATGIVSTIAGAVYSADATCSNCAVDGAGTSATFNYPYGITTDGSSLYVVDSGNSKIRKIAPANGTLSSMTSSTAVVSSMTGVADTPGLSNAADGAREVATFNEPNGISTDGINLYVVDQFNNKIRKIVIANGVVSSLTGKVNTVGVTGLLDGAGAEATFRFPMGITTDGSSLYVTDSHTIRKIQ